MYIDKSKEYTLVISWFVSKTKKQGRKSDLKDFVHGLKKQIEHGTDIYSVPITQDNELCFCHITRQLTCRIGLIIRNNKIKNYKLLNI